MGLMDKFKNLFTDEEIIEEENEEPIEIKEVKKEEPVQQLPTFMREKIEKEERAHNISKETFNSGSEDLGLKEELEIKKELKLQGSLDNFVDVEETKTETKSAFKFPLDLEENDFVETRSRQSIHNHEVIVPEKRVAVSKPEVKKESSVSKDTKVASLYKDKKKEGEEVKKFRSTPIISPIYGVLDKNYSPNDVESNKGENFETRRHSKSVDFDSVRKKAYGSITEEIKENLMCENCEYLKEAKECKKNKERKLEKCEPVSYETEEVASTDYVYEVLEDSQMTDYQDITLDEATENYFDYGVEYQKNNVVEEEVKILNFDEEKKPKKEIPPVKSSINLLSTLKKSMGDEVEEPPKAASEKNLELTDDLFNLIDSMYDERNDS